MPGKALCEVACLNAIFFWKSKTFKKPNPDTFVIVDVFGIQHCKNNPVAPLKQQLFFPVNLTGKIISTVITV